MKLDTIFKQLKNGELSQLYAMHYEEGELPKEKKEAILTHINTALTALHKRFFLREDRVVINLQPDQFQYVLDSRFAQSNTRSKEPVKYLNDTGNPFKDNVIQIEQLLDVNGDEVPLNNEGLMTAIRTPNHKTLVLPPKMVGHPSEGEHLLDYSPTLTVVYRGNHPALEERLAMYPEERVEVDLPDVYMEPLLYFIAGRMMSPLGARDGYHPGNNYAAMYERACQQLENEGYTMTGTEPTYNFNSAGWV